MRDGDAPDHGRDWLTWAGVWGLLAVAAGAFGAHGLEDVAARAGTGAEGLAWWDTAALYHLVHALALGLAGVVQRLGGPARRAGCRAGWCFLFGSAVFSGTLYAMALGAPRWLGAVTPLGGLGMLAGWGCLALARAR